MNFIKKIAVALGLFIGAQAHAGVIYLDSLLHGARNEAAVRKAILEYIQTHGKVVFYFGTENCKACISTKDAINKLLSQFPDVIFVIVDLAQYGYLKGASWPRLRFHKNGTFLTETKSLTMPQLKALLNSYYR